MEKIQFARNPADIGTKVAILFLFAIAGYLDKHVPFQSFLLFAIYLKMRD